MNIKLLAPLLLVHTCTYMSISPSTAADKKKADPCATVENADQVRVPEHIEECTRQGRQ